MHTADSTHTEVALSKLTAALAVTEEAARYVESGDHVDALERIEKAHAKLLGASRALAGTIEREPRRWRFLGTKRST